MSSSAFNVTGETGVTSVTAGSGLSGGTITGSGTISLTAPVSGALGGTGVNNGAHTLTVNANSTINQDVSTTATPNFAQLGVGPTGSITISPPTAGMGNIIIAAENNAGAYDVLVSNDSFGQSSVITMPDPGASLAKFILTSINSGSGSQNITQGSLQVETGDIVSGNTTSYAGTISLNPGTSNGFLRLVASDNSVNAQIIISNASFGQDSYVVIPDPGTNYAEFLLTTGATNIIAFTQFISLQSKLFESGGTFTMTRLAQGDYGLVHTVAANTSLLAFDITEAIRSATNKGFELTSIDFIYDIGSLALIAHSATLNQVVYANNTANAVTTIATTGSLATATQTQPYVTNLSVNTPAFLNQTDAKYVVELTVQTNTTTTYTLYGMVMYFNQTIA